MALSRHSVVNKIIKEPYQEPTATVIGRYQAASSDRIRRWTLYPATAGTIQPWPGFP
jgi:hypothetical protein